MSLLGKVLLAAGCVLFVCAVGWWYLFFEQFLGEDVKDASACFYVTSDICSLAEYAAIMSDIPAYSPWALWAAASAAIVGVFILAFSPR